MQMELRISKDEMSAELLKPNGRKNRYEIVQVGDLYKVYVSRKRNNSKWSEKFLLCTSKEPIKIIQDDTQPMKIEFKPY